MSDLANLIRREVERAISVRFTKRYGIVTSYDPDRHLAKATLQPEGQELGWLTIRANHVGNGWGMVVGLTAGDQVTLEPQSADLNTFEITGVVHSDNDAPPRAESGEIVIRHQSGASVTFAKDKSVTIADGGGGSIRFDGAGSVTING